MCNLYRIISNVAAMRRLFAGEGPVPKLPLFGEVSPNREAPIIRADDAGMRRIEVGRRGMPPPGNC